MIDESDEEFGRLFGRTYGGMVEAYQCEDAEVILVTIGSVTGTTRVVVDACRAEGKKVGLLKLRCVRPFPTEKVAAIVKNAKAVGVMERDISFGFEGAVYSDFNSALKQQGVDVPTYNYVGGLGGRSISKEDISSIFDALLAGNTEKPVEFINVRRDIDYGA